MTVIDILQDFKIPYKSHSEHHHVHTGWVGVDCSHCSPNSGKYKRGINLNSLAVSCWTCGIFKLPDTLAELCHIPIHEAYKLSSQLHQGRAESYSYPIHKPPGTLKLPPGLTSLARPHKHYLEKRGFDPSLLESVWGLQGLGLCSRLPWRLFFPIIIGGEIVSWTTRAISDKAERRYINARPDEEKISLKECLYGIDFVRHSVIIVEGPLDAIKIGPGCVATMGVNVTKEQIRLLSKIPVRVVCLDSEPIAQIRAEKLVSELSTWPGETWNVKLESGKDPSRADQEEVGDLRKRFLE